MLAAPTQGLRVSSPEKLGPYLIGEPLGKGGMGTVYRAVNEQSGEGAAVKMLSPALAMEEGFRERFEAEIESLRTLRHPNIVRLLGYGEEDGVLFYGMELIDGVSLEDELRHGRRFNWREVTDIGIQVSRALKHAHDHGIIHRDIKPANILLADQQVKLADFGIARLFGATRLTAAQGVIGTADFMSPEQADGSVITDRSDQYSLGGVMYALLAGRPPFRAKTLPEMLQMQRYAKPEPVSRFAADTPRQLEEVVMQLLEKAPGDRFPNAMALAKHLEAMKLALSRPELHEADFEVRPESDDDPELQIDTLPDNAAGAPPRLADDAEFETLAAVTRDYDSAHTAKEPGDTLSGPAAEGGARFTIVSDDPPTSEDARPVWQTIALGAALLAAITAIAWGLIQGIKPPTADQLYGRIQAASEQGENALLGEEEPIAQFLRRYKDDPRAEEVRSLKQQLNFAKAERRMTAMLRRRATSDQPLESLYLEAMRVARDNPDQALAQLRSMTDLMAGVEPGELDQSTRLMLKVAQQQVEQLERRVAKRAAVQLPLLAGRVERARLLRDQDPEAARRIAAAVVRLYDGREWATDVVADAQRLLSELPARQ